MMAGAMDKDPDITDLLGAVLVSAVRADRSATFETDTGDIYTLEHDQDCCEDVYLEDVAGDLADLVGSPLVLAEVSENPPESPESPPEDHYHGSHTWTFYRLATAKGHITMRFYGTSNGYYSERVTVHRSRRADRIAAGGGS
jgi:hypothetical protein